jgi:hypothetical protein
MRSMGQTSLPFGLPALEDRADIAPAPLVLLDRLAEGGLEPFGGVLLGGISQFLGQQRQDQAHILLIQREDVGALDLDQQGLARGGVAVAGADDRSFELKQAFRRDFARQEALDGALAA